jgi:hypothetical protein
MNGLEEQTKARNRVSSTDTGDHFWEGEMWNCTSKVSFYFFLIVLLFICAYKA